MQEPRRVLPQPSTTPTAITKNIVLCCDGTSHDVVSHSSNVLRLFQALERDDRQLIYYDSGVGTLPDPTKLTTYGRRITQKLDMAIGASVRDNACRAYQFLAQRYQPGDRIYLFGFSRGAYTVRALAGMIRFLGLVRPEHENLAQLGWTVYAGDDPGLSVAKRFESGRRFRETFSRERNVLIELIGAWDTVSSFGWIWNLRNIPYTSNNSSVRHIRHAVAIDERRSSFQANLFRPKDMEQHESFKQVWFAGSHGDVGGGYPESESGLAKIALEWVLREAERLGCHFDQVQVAKVLGLAAGDGANSSRPPPHDSLLVGPDAHRHGGHGPNPCGPCHRSITGFWHALEWLPRKRWDAERPKRQMRWFAPNLYRRRPIPEESVLHRSVARKLESDPSYRPRNLPRAFRYDEA